MTMQIGFKRIAIARECESPENPGALEKRVALVPDDAAALLAAGCEVSLESGAGEGVGFSDADYAAVGVKIETADTIYRDKDLIIKFKGPSLESIPQMRPGTTLFCMAHFHSYPDRAALLEQQQINVLAMEEVLESPKSQSDERIIGRMAMNDALVPFIKQNIIGGLRIRVLQWTPRLDAAIRRAGNRDPRSLDVLREDVEFEELKAFGDEALYVFDSATLTDSKELLPKLRASGCHLYDVNEYARDGGALAVSAYRAAHPPLEFGGRRIQCLHETGRAGARYGVDLLKKNRPGIDMRTASACVLGYGNVGQGAIHELYEQGIGCVHVLGRTHTVNGRIDYWLQNADIVVNGAEQPPELRGKNYLVTNQHLKTLLAEGSVVIDLVGGSPTNRSPVEPVLSCTFLTDPHFVQDGVTVSSLWGWPMMGMMRETAIRYSGQIREVLLDQECAIQGLDLLTPGVARALVCGPHCVD